MKKLFFIAAVAALLAVACNKEGGKTGETTDLEGKWIAIMDNHHPLDLTFEGNKYIWHVGGVTPMKETGTFTYENNTISFKGEKYWTCGATWDESGPVEDGNWVESAEKFGNHKYKVLSLTKEAMDLESKGDDMYGDGFVFHMVYGDGQSLTANDLKGSWYGFVPNSEGGFLTKYLITFDGNNYSLRYIYYNYDNSSGEWKSVLVITKEEGTWKHSKNILTLTASKKYDSFAIVNMNPTRYNYYTVDEANWNAAGWYEITNPYEWEWTVAKVNGKLLTVIQTDPVEFEKQ
ncbi:MAG: hypothetical protein IKZ60_02695 [Bacteroidales bacterium]|nr:hypothetical protein [Bacteroidales bacterium]